jgi:hypothetical protein
MGFLLVFLSAQSRQVSRFKLLPGYAKEKLLETYNEERLPNAQRLLEITDQAFNMMVGSHWFFGFMRITIFPLVAKYAIGRDLVGKNIFAIMSQTRINYRNATLSKHHGDQGFRIKAGDRMPYFLVNGSNIYDKLRAPKFHLLAFSDGTDSSLGLQRTIENQSENLIDFMVIPLSPHITKIFGINKSFQLLLRPDNYIGFISTRAALFDLKAYTYEFLEHPIT